MGSVTIVVQCLLIFCVIGTFANYNADVPDVLLNDVSPLDDSSAKFLKALVDNGLVLNNPQICRSLGFFCGRPSDPVPNSVIQTPSPSEKDIIQLPTKRSSLFAVTDSEIENAGSSYESKQPVGVGRWAKQSESPELSSYETKQPFGVGPEWGRSELNKQPFGVGPEWRRATQRELNSQPFSVGPEWRRSELNKQPFGVGPEWRRSTQSEPNSQPFGVGPEWRRAKLREPNSQPFGVGPEWRRSELNKQPFGVGPEWRQAKLSEQPFGVGPEWRRSTQSEPNSQPFGVGPEWRRSELKHQPFGAGPEWRQAKLSEPNSQPFGVGPEWRRSTQREQNSQPFGVGPEWRRSTKSEQNSQPFGVGPEWRRSTQREQNSQPFGVGPEWRRVPKHNEVNAQPFVVGPEWRRSGVASQPFGVGPEWRGSELNKQPFGVGPEWRRSTQSKLNNLQPFGVGPEWRRSEQTSYQAEQPFGVGPEWRQTKQTVHELLEQTSYEAEQPFGVGPEWRRGKEHEHHQFGVDQEHKHVSDRDETKALAARAFRLAALQAGKSILLPYIIEETPNKLVHPLLAESVPFSYESLPKVMRIFSIPPSSPFASSMARSLQLASVVDDQVENRKPFVSVKAMVEFAGGILCNSSSGVDCHLHSIAQSFENKSPVTVNIADVEELAKDAVACHTVPFPYEVYGCHKIIDSTILKVTVKDGDETKVLPAMCHMNTADFSPDHPAFKDLNMKPGDGEICHWMAYKTLVWYA